MVENSDFHAEVEALIAEQRWQEALDLLNTQERSRDLLALRTKIEAHFGYISAGEAYIIAYVGEHRNGYGAEAIESKLLLAGYTLEAVRKVFRLYGLQTAAEKHPQNRDIPKPVATFTGIMLGLVTIFVVVSCLSSILIGSCKYG